MTEVSEAKSGGLFKNKALIVLVSAFALLIVVGILTT